MARALIVTSFISCLILVQGFDKGFELLYSTNSAEFQQVPVKFENPLPPWINGSFIHNGLGQFKMGGRNVSHFFDGFAKMVGWTFVGGNKANFTNKFIRSGYFKDSMAEDDIAPYMLFESPDPAFSVGEKILQLVNGQDNANVNIVKLGDDYVAVGDFYKVYQIDERQLKTVKGVNPPLPKGGYTANMPNILSTSHPVPEYGTNNMINTATVPNPLGLSSVSIVRCNSSSGRELIARISMKNAPYFHSFSATEKYVLLFINPVTFDLQTLIETLEPAAALIWDPNGNTTVYVVEIATGKVTTLTTEAAFGLHHVNSYTQDDGKIVVDIVTYPDSKVISAQLIKTLIDPVKRNEIPFGALLKRYVVDLENKVVDIVTFPTLTENKIAVKFDFPVFNENYRFKKYCYVYGTAFKIDGKNYAKWALVKKDLCDPAGDKIWYHENTYPGEPWFVARPGAAEEDDGHLLVIMLDGERAISYLAVFDAKNMTMINTSYLTFHLPMTLHGRYFEQYNYTPIV